MPKLLCSKFTVKVALEAYHWTSIASVPLSLLQYWGLEVIFTTKASSTKWRDDDFRILGISKYWSTFSMLLKYCVGTRANFLSPHVHNLVPRVLSYLPYRARERERPWKTLVTWLHNKINSDGGVLCLTFFFCLVYSQCSRSDRNSKIDLPNLLQL